MSALHMGMDLKIFFTDSTNSPSTQGLRGIHFIERKLPLQFLDLVTASASTQINLHSFPLCTYNVSEMVILKYLMLVFPSLEVTYS